MANTTTSAVSNAWTLPNILTYARVAAVPIVVGLLLWSSDAWAHWTALVIYVAAGLTDFFDGYFARAWGQQSSLGRMLDPIADKLLVSAVLLELTADGMMVGVHFWAAFIILCREVLVSGLREHLADLRVPVPVTTLAKWKTALQLVALGFLIAGQAGERILPGTILIGRILLWAAAILTLYTGWDYLKASYDHLGNEP